MNLVRTRHCANAEDAQINNVEPLPPVTHIVIGKGAQEHCCMSDHIGSVVLKMYV